MRTRIWLFAAVPFFACVCAGAQQGGKAEDGKQRLAVLRSGRLVAPSESLSNADANCKIVGTDGEARMECRPLPATVRTSFHYNTALVVDGKGTGYVIACRVGLVTAGCRKLDPGVVVYGTFGQGNVVISDGDKIHNYVVLLNGYVGQATLAQPQAQSPERLAASQPTQTAATPMPATGSTPLNLPSVDRPEKAPEDSTATCMSYAGACVAFASDPPGADIYVDGKFVGDTPSTIALAAGSHDIRIETEKYKSWTRTLDANAGSKLTIRAKLEAEVPKP